MSSYYLNNNDNDNIKGTNFPNENEDIEMTNSEKDYSEDFDKESVSSVLEKESDEIKIKNIIEKISKILKEFMNSNNNPNIPNKINANKINTNNLNSPNKKNSTSNICNYSNKISPDKDKNNYNKNSNSNSNSPNKINGNYWLLFIFNIIKLR